MLANRKSAESFLGAASPAGVLFWLWCCWHQEVRPNRVSLCTLHVSVAENGTVLQASHNEVTLVLLFGSKRVAFRVFDISAESEF